MKALARRALRSPRTKRSGPSPQSAGTSGAGARAKLLAALGATVAAMLLLAASASAATLAPSFDSSFACTAAAAGCNLTKIAVDEATGDIYAIDSAHGAIDVFEADGSYKSQIAGSFTFQSNGAEDDIAVDNSGTATQGNVYVETGETGEYLAFDSSGTPLWQKSGGGGGEVCGIGVESDGTPAYMNYYTGLQHVSAADGSPDGSPVSPLGTGPQDFCQFSFGTGGDIIARHYSGAMERFSPTGAAMFKYHPDINYEDVASDLTNGDAYGLTGSKEAFAWKADGTLIAGPEQEERFARNLAFLGIAADGAHHRVYLTTGAGVSVYSVPVPHKLELEPIGSGSGSVTCNGGTCESEYPEGEPVELEVHPAGDSEFLGWSGGGCSGTGTTCTVDLTADTTVSVEFGLIEYEVGVAKSGSGSGQVTSVPAGIICGEACSALFPKGEFLSLTATADPGSEFAGWSGACSNASGPCAVAELAGDVAVTATFNLIPHEEGGGNNGGGGNGGGAGNSGGGGSSSPAPTPTIPPVTEKPAPKPTYGQCVKSANGAYKKVLKAAKRKHGKARVRAIKAAQKKKGRAVVKCKKRFGKPLPKHHHKRHRR